MPAADVAAKRILELHPRRSSPAIVTFAFAIAWAAAAVLSPPTALAQGCVQVPPGSISWWPGEHGAEDIVGLNDGILGPTTSFGQGMVGMAFEVDEDGDTTTVPKSPSLDLPAGSSFTIELWAFRNSPSWPQHLLGKRDGCGLSGDDPDFYQVAIGLTDLGGSAFPPATVPLGEWSHLAVVWDGPTNEVRHYVNGAVVFSDVRVHSGTNDAPLTIGNSGTGCARFDGWIDEVSLYGRVLSQTEIEGIVGAGSFGKCIARACNDGVDNDSDGLVDYPADPGCRNAAFDREDPECDDGVDNDGDGIKDVLDPECLRASDRSERIDCGDGVDNDSDGLADTADPGCLNVAWGYEDPECSDGVDNDGDGQTDWDGAGVGPADSQCAAAHGFREKPQSGACGLGVEVAFAMSLFLSRAGKARA